MARTRFGPTFKRTRYDREARKGCKYSTVPCLDCEFEKCIYELPPEEFNQFVILNNDHPGRKPKQPVLCQHCDQPIFFYRGNNGNHGWVHTRIKDTFRCPKYAEPIKEVNNNG